MKTETRPRSLPFLDRRRARPILLGIARRRTRPLALCLVGPFALRLALAGVVLVPLWKAFLLLTGATPDRLYNAFDTRLDTLMVGCTAALLWARPEVRRRISEGLSGPWTPWLIA